VGSRFRLALRSGVALTSLALAFASGPSAPSAPPSEELPQDDIVLTLSHGFSAGQVVLQWTG